MQVTIDSHSGFCFGVVHAIGIAERELKKNPELCCLGDIVHNEMEVNRLTQMGLRIINHETFKQLSNCRVLIRAHGEPPETYRIALENGIELIDASCPIVLNLQNSVHRAYIEMVTRNGQVVIYGKEDHAEVVALNGQTNGSALVVEKEEDIERVDFKLPVRLFSQTTKSVEGFQKIVSLIQTGMEAAAGDRPADFEWNDSVCRQVSNRSDQLKEFASRFEVVVFVSGLKSSNGIVLFEACSAANPRSYMVSGVAEVMPAWFDGVHSVGICGATSTPSWLMEKIAQEIRIIND
ncbi:MAG: 4-hydroxy-3-methylbut-2-enyl diphosphate reductase [Bacteroidales bacterium]